jgi:predicted metal-dependent phosphotriesterase family hydrolase
LRSGIRHANNNRVPDLGRRQLLTAGFVCLAERAWGQESRVQTTRGPVDPKSLGLTLIHEHILVDFIGAEKVSRDRYRVEEVIEAALPKLLAVRKAGCRTLVECTPAYLGRDPRLLAELAKRSGLHILTNTGYYGAANDKHLPAHAFTETAEALAARWIDEARNGIEGTGIRPAFQKIGVDAGPLSPIDRKLIEAACLTWKANKLRLHVHTGNGEAALGIAEVMKSGGVPGSAYVWVHAQNEKDLGIHEQAAKQGVWLEFDGINAKSHERHLMLVTEMWKRGFGKQILISQDSGWYRVGEPGGGQFNGYTYLFETFVPALKASGLTARDIDQLLIDNPRRVLAAR